MTPADRPSTKNSPLNFFSILLELAIVLGGVLWVAYEFLPREYYLPISLVAIVLIGFASFFILDRKVVI